MPSVGKSIEIAFGHNFDSLKLCLIDYIKRFNQIDEGIFFLTGPYIAQKETMSLGYQE